MNWYQTKVKKVKLIGLLQDVEVLMLNGLIDLSLSAEFFYRTVTCDVEKTFYLLFKSFEQFY